MDWTPGERPGVFSKILSRDPSTGMRTALQCADPARGYRSPHQQHYHDGDEELFVLKGRFSFDQVHWLGRMSYCFHPARTVHGFRSKTLEESWFISRISKRVEFFYADDPRDMKPYSLDGQEPERQITVIFDPRTREWEEVRDDSGRVSSRRLILSRHPTTGEGSMLVELAPGWSSPHGDHFHSVYLEAFHIEGETQAADGTVYGPGCYRFKPPRTVQSALSSAKGALLYVNFGGPIDYLPA
jgi:quercetin dioxygenase-like cupin family protein